MTAQITTLPAGVAHVLLLRSDQRVGGRLSWRQAPYPRLRRRYLPPASGGAGRIGGRALDPELMASLNRELPPDGEPFRRLREACEQGVAEGWMCRHEAGGIRFGRVVKAGPATHGFSVDVVYMNQVVGPHHRHPNGEIDMIMPIDDSARFDGHGAGWLVYPPESAHEPTVSGGAAYVMYLLPDGAIEFTR